VEAGLEGSAAAKAKVEAKAEAEASPMKRALGVLGLSLVVLFGGTREDLPGGAVIAVIVGSTVAARDWGKPASKAAGAWLDLLWTSIMQPLLFALVGAAVDLRRLSGSIVGLGLVVLLVGLAARSLAAFAAAGGGHLTFNERVFVTLAWLPKATGQAALAGLPLDAAVEVFGRGSREANDAEVLLALGVLSIAVTAPLGSMAVALTGERLLVREAEEWEAREASA
jgi:NhaP-type Na+/H+ or K+/H+ antiporter